MAVSERPSPRPKHPSFTRRMATKVVSLIAKFEALNSTYPPSPNSPVPSRSFESKLSSPRSISKYSGFSKTLSRKASRMFTRLGKDKEDDGQTVPVRVTPPKRRILQDATRKRRRAWEWRRRGGEEGERTDGHFSQNEGELLLNGEEEEGEVVGPEPTPPPVARVLPSSFFMQLVAPDDQKKKIEVDKRQFRLQPGFQPKQSVWRRKITPPKVSVKDLISRFKNSPETEDPEDLCVPARVVLPAKVVDPRKKATNTSLTVPDRLLPPLASPDGTTVFASARTTQFATGTKAPRPSLEVFTRSSRADTTPSDTSKHPSLVPSLATPEPLNISKEVSVTVSPLAIEKETTSSKSSSEASGITVRIQESFSPSPELRPDTPPTRKYRKTPPPTGFFAKVRGTLPGNIGWGAPSLYTLSSDESEASDEADLGEVEQQEENSEESPTASEMSLPSGWSEFSEEGIMIGVGVPAVDIVQPTPHREVQTRKMLGLIGRYY